MIPLHLTLSGFLSYRDPVELDFTEFDLACIAGPNGAGKSSLLDAITWALFGQARKRDDSLINTQSDMATVSLIFSYEGNIYRVTRIKPREKTAMLEFHILQDEVSSSMPEVSSLKTWKPLTERTLRETENRIQQVLRLDYETFVNAAFFLQGKADQFTQQRPGDRKRILGSILGLEVWEVYRHRTIERRKQYENQAAALEGRLDEIDAELAEEEIRKERLKSLEDELARLSRERAAQEAALENIRKIAATLAEQRKLVATLQRQAEASAERLAQLQARHASRLQEKNQHAEILSRAEAIEASYADWHALREELQRLEEVAARFREQEKRRSGPRDEINAARARLEQELSSLLQQQARIIDSQQEVAELERQALSVRQAIAEAEDCLKRRSELDASLETLQKNQVDAKAENLRLKTQMAELKERIDRLSAAGGAVCPLCGQPLSPEERQNLIEQLQAEGREMGNRYRLNQKLLREADEQMAACRAEIEALARVEKDLHGHNRTLDGIASRLEVRQKEIAEWEQQGAPRLQEIETRLKAEDFAPEARAKLAEIDAELKQIGYDAAAHDEVRRREQAGRASEGELRRLESARAALAPLERELEDLFGQISALQAEAQKQQEEYTNAAASLAAAEAQAPDLRQAEHIWLQLQEQENRLRLEVGAAQQKVQILDTLKTRRKSLEAQREQLALQISRHRTLERAFSKDGVPALLIEQALPQIEIKSNEILERLSGGNMSVRFITQAAYKDKKRDDMKETLDISISDGAGTRDYEMFSGGEAFRVNFAIRLALSEVLAQRAGARLQTLVIDEGFGSQDTQGRQRLVEAINLVRHDFAKILVITHIDELKDAFPNRIEVEKTERGSTIRVV